MTAVQFSVLLSSGMRRVLDKSCSKDELWCIAKLSLCVNKEKKVSTISKLSKPICCPSLSKTHTQYKWHYCKPTRSFICCAKLLVLSPYDHKIPSALSTTHCITTGKERNNETFANFGRFTKSLHGITHPYDFKRTSKPNLSLKTKETFSLQRIGASRTWSEEL